MTCTKRTLLLVGVPTLVYHCRTGKGGKTPSSRGEELHQDGIFYFFTFEISETDRSNLTAYARSLVGHLRISCVHAQRHSKGENDHDAALQIRLYGGRTGRKANTCQLFYNPNARRRHLRCMSSGRTKSDAASGTGKCMIQR